MAVFDKSFIHSINADEAAVFDMHFMTNLTPLFFIEVAADLEKAKLDEARRIALVQSLAGKTPVYRSYSNVPHNEIVLHDLLGDGVELRGVPIVGGGRRVQTPDGLGTVFEEPPEMRAKTRWHAGRFEIADFILARMWRDVLRAAPEATERVIGGSANRFTFHDLPAVKSFVDALLERDGVRYRTLVSSLEVLGVRDPHRDTVIGRWKREGGPKLQQFAPYATHVLKVDLFRVLAMASGLISPDKTSNYADMAYLYYLPFCEVFISCDKLHRQCAPLFLQEKQRFIWGHDLRPALSEMVSRYLAEPDVEEVGLIGVAQRETFPPGTFLGDLFDAMHAPGWRDHFADLSPKLTPEQEAALVAKLKAIQEAPPAEDPRSVDDDRSFSFTRKIPPRRGRFPFMPRASRAKAESD